jgi:hypothetical protein
MSFFDFFNGAGGTSEDEEKKPIAKFSDACFLMDYIEDIVASAEDENKNGFKNFKVIDSDRPESAAAAHRIIPKLTSRDGIDQFLDISPASLATLQPRIKLYKVIYQDNDVNSQKKQELEFVFEDFFSNKRIEDVLNQKSNRIGGAGITECSWKLDGTNPAEAERVIKVNMTFEFQSPLDLLGDRYDPAGGFIKAPDDLTDNTPNLIDLILHPPQLTEVTGFKASLASDKGQYVPKFYRIKLEIGWAVPDTFDGKIPGVTAVPNSQNRNKDPHVALKEELEKQRMSLMLNLVSHDLSIKENGGLTLSVQYIASLEEAINGNQADILNIIKRLEGAASEKTEFETRSQSAEARREQIADLEERIECLKLNNEEVNEKDEDDLQKLKDEAKQEQEELDGLTSGEKSAVYKQFLELLNDRVYGFNLRRRQVEKWLESLDRVKRPKFSDVASEITKKPSKNSKDAEEAVDDAANEKKKSESSSSFLGGSEDFATKAKNEAVDKDKKRLNYLFFGDILDVACEVMNSQLNSEVDNMRILTGPIIIQHPRGRRIITNLADLPVSYDDFQNFFFETVVRKQLASYPLMQFVRDVLERLVKKVLQPSECFPKEREKRAIKISTTIFPISLEAADKLGIGRNNRSCSGRLNIDQLCSIEPIGENEEVMNCMLFYLAGYRASELKGNVIDDRDKGIYHFYIGSDRGIVKSIDYARADVEGLREARQAEARNLGQIRDIYNAKVKLVGNTMFYPGMKVFLSPPIGFGDPTKDGTKNGIENPDSYGSLANMLGIGGYYDVITVDSTISRGGQYETELDCVFAQSGGPLDSIDARCDTRLSKTPGENNQDDNPNQASPCGKDPSEGEDS